MQFASLEQRAQAGPQVRHARSLVVDEWLLEKSDSVFGSMLLELMDLGGRGGCGQIVGLNRSG